MRPDNESRQTEPGGVSTRYRRIAPLYDLVDLPFEYVRYRRLRRLLVKGLRGDILEVGVGTGRNLPFYSRISRVTGLDNSSAMLIRAERRAHRARVPVRLLNGDVCATGFADASFDAVVASFVLCVLPSDQRLPALRELARVCKRGGEIRLLEYSRSGRPWRRALMRLWEPWAKWAFGADFDVDIEAMLPQTGLTVSDSRYVVSDIIRLFILFPQDNPGRTAVPASMEGVE